MMAEDNSDELIREFYGIDLAGPARYKNAGSDDVGGFEDHQSSSKAIRSLRFR
jgi:hypothetical protein